MSMSDLLNHLGSIWHHSEPSVSWHRDFFCHFLQQGGSNSATLVENSEKKTFVKLTVSRTIFKSSFNLFINVWWLSLFKTTNLWVQNEWVLIQSDTTDAGFALIQDSIGVWDKCLVTSCIWSSFWGVWRKIIYLVVLTTKMLEVS